MLHQFFTAKHWFASSVMLLTGGRAKKQSYHSSLRWLLLLTLLPTLAAHAQAPCVTATYTTGGTGSNVPLYNVHQQSFTATCSGRLTTMAFNFPNTADDFRSTGYSVKASLTDAAGTTVLATLPFDDNVFPGQTRTYDFSAANVVLTNGTQYRWELRQIQNSTGTTDINTPIFLLQTFSGNPYAGGQAYSLLPGGGSSIPPTSDRDFRGWTVNLGPAVQTGTIASPLCAGTAVAVPFTAYGTIGSGNIYTAQLSNASGSFASPVSIGTLSSTASSGSISATIPGGTAAGSGYRIQVVASTAGFAPIPNTSNLTINNTAAPTGAASQSFSSGATVANLVATGTAIQWYAASTGGTALASTTALTNGTTYYATQTVNGCESQSRLAVTATVTTPVTTATVTTTAPASIATTSATLGGNVTNDGGAAITERGVVYIQGTNTPTTANTKLTAAGTTGAYTVSATGLTAGTQYTVRAYATNSQGTSYGANQTFTTAATLAASISSQTNVSCNAGTNGAATVTATGGVTPYSYSWNTTPVQTTATATNLAAGTYTVTVTDAASQTTTATATITQPAALAATTGQTNVACFGGSTGAASVSVSGGTPSYTYSWNTSPVRTTAAITGLPAGTYTVTVADNNSCTLTRSVTITQPGSALAATASKTDATTNGGTNGTATANVSGGTPSYTYSWNTNPVQTTATATGLAAGTYTVTVTDANSCTTTASATVGQPAALTVSTGTVNGSPFCAGSAISVPFTASAAPNSGNVYTAQLSTASGSFASPVSIGTLSSTATSGTVSGTVPTSTAQGSGYRVRVVASSPATTGTDNGANLTVNNTAAPTGSASQSFSSGATVANLVATGTAIQWYAASTGGTALASTTALTNGTTYYATQTVNGCESLTRLAVTVTINAPANLTVDNTNSTAGAPYSIAAGTYNNITITGTGFGQLAGNVVVGGAFSVSGSLNTNCQALTGSGSFALAAGGTLYVCDVAGLTTSGNTGAVQTATRSFASDASYVYNGTAAQATGNGLPAAVRNLTTTNANAVTLTAPVGVVQALTVGGAGNLVLNGQALTLLSDATGTALVVNSGTGVVSGTATMQRYIGVNTGGNGYRHYSSPVQGETFSTLATAGYAPDFSGAATYNNSLTPGTTTPFPTVFRYNQDRIAGSGSNYSVFDKGFEAVTNTVGDNAMEVGRGYAVNAPGSALVDFAGTLTTGPVTRSGLNRASADANTGWHLLGNPYPAPLDWSTLSQGAANTDNLQNMDGAVYVFQSAGPYTGTYRTYLRNAPTGNSSPLIPAGSAFFVHTTAPGTPGTLRLTDANRVTTFGAQPAFGRGAADTRPAVQLELRGVSGVADAFTAYAQPGATAGFDNQLDAQKLPNTTGLNLASTTATGEALAIDGRPVFAAGTVLPLTVGVPAAGTYTLAAAALNNLPAGLDAFLADAATGRVVNLRTQPDYAFTVSATQAAATIAGRFTLSFAAAAPLATSSALAAAQVLAYPNPAHDRLTVVRPLGSSASAVLLNALGQVVRRVALPTAETTLDLHELATGVYVLRLTLDGQPVTKRVVVE